MHATRNNHFHIYEILWDFLHAFRVHDAILNAAVIKFNQVAYESNYTCFKRVY